MSDEVIQQVDAEAGFLQQGAVMPRQGGQVPGKLKEEEDEEEEKFREEPEGGDSLRSESVAIRQRA